MFAFLKEKPARIQARALYASLAAASRQPELYRQLAVPDTPEGRFEMMTLHSWLILRRLKALDAGEEAQNLVNVFFAELDAALRESGIGDMGVPPRMRRMARAFYARLNQLDEADTCPAALAKIFAETLYAGEQPVQSLALADYVRQADETLARLTLAELPLADFPKPAAS